MARQITFWLDGPIPSKSNFRFDYRAASRAKWKQITSYQSKAGAAANEAMAAKGMVARTGEVAVRVEAYNQRLDIDNVFKVILDGLEKVCYLNDSQVRSVSARKVKDKKGKRAKVTVIWEE